MITLSEKRAGGATLKMFALQRGGPMMYKHRAIRFVLLAVVSVVLLTSGCGPKLPEMETYTGEEMGFSIGHPVDWFVESSAMGVVFASNEEMLSRDADGAGLAVFVVPAAQLEGGLETTEVTDEALSDEWGSVVGGMGIPVGEPESLTVGGEEALRGTIDDTEEGIVGWLAMTRSSGNLYMFLALARPTDLWGDNEPVLGAMLDSVEFTP
jgi:hypothetical protein